MSENQKHPYHLVDPSPWPLVTAISLLVLAYGLVVMMHQESSVLFYIGGAGVLLTSILWWKDVVDESKSGKFHNRVVQIGLRYGMILLIFFGETKKTRQKFRLDNFSNSSLIIFSFLGKKP